MKPDQHPDHQLFEALGEVDPELVQRSNQRYRPRPSLRSLAAWAACLVLVSGVGVTLYRQHNPAPTAESAQPLPDPAPSTPSTPSTAPDPVPSPASGSVWQPKGTAVGALHLCQLGQPGQPGPLDDETAPAAAPDAAPLPAFVIHVNRELYATAEEAGTYVIRPREAPASADAPDPLPPVLFTIRHEPTASAAAAMQTMAERLAGEYAEVSAITEPVQGRLSLTAGNGTAWNAAQVQVWGVPDTQGGCFLLTARYFTEAEEGHGVRFRDMAETFQVVPEGSQVPEWMRLLCRTSDQLMAAIFSNRLEDIADRIDLGDSGFLSGYDEDVSADLSVAAVDYTIEYTTDDATEEEQPPSAAIVSVKHRIHLEDSFNYLTMELRYEGSRWVLCSAGIEK